MKIGILGAGNISRKVAPALVALPEPTAIRDIGTDFGRVRAYQWGEVSEHPVLLIPGRASGAPMWSENLPGLLAGRGVIAFDLLGDAGLSHQSAPYESFAQVAEPIDELVRTMAPQGVHVVGHSFGGAVAMAYARAHPEHVRSLSLLEPVFVLGYPSPRQLGWTVLASLPLPTGLRTKALEKIAGEKIDPVEMAEDPVAAMIGAGSRHFRGHLPNPALPTDEELAGLKMPVYVAIAGESSLTGGAKARRRAEAMPRAEVEVWPGTTHSLPMQASGRIEPRLLEFFAQAEGA